MLRQRRWVRACAHDSGDAQGGDPRLPTSCMRRARPGLRADELVVTWEAADGGTRAFSVTGKPNTATTFAFTVGGGATYKHNMDQDEGDQDSFACGVRSFPSPLA